MVSRHERLKPDRKEERLASYVALLIIPGKPPVCIDGGQCLADRSVIIKHRYD